MVRDPALQAGIEMRRSGACRGDDARVPGRSSEAKDVEKGALGANGAKGTTLEPQLSIGAG